MLHTQAASRRPFAGIACPQGESPEVADGFLAVSVPAYWARVMTARLRRGSS